MFYSHTFLARKSPLGTVWIAAFLQHKLRKSHVALIDISSSVDRIMFPEVPIALRLSGHLLVGVVRIYSKKVDYLFHDCNEVLTHIRTAFASIQVNLPDDATHAPFDFVTRPETFELDALDVNEATYQADAPDIHLKSFDQITIADQMPAEENSYVAILVDEDRIDLSPTPEGSNRRFRPMAEDVLPPFPLDFEIGVADPGSSDHAEPNEKFYEDQPLHEIPEIERNRDHVQPLEAENIFEPRDTTPPVELRCLSQTSQKLSVSGESVPSLRYGPVERSVEGLEVSSVSRDKRPVSTEMALQPTPPMENQKAKSRKRKQLFDESIVLTNKMIKQQLGDSNKLLRKRKSLPCTALDVWRCRKRMQVEQMFLQLPISGICVHLQEAWKKSFSASSPMEPSSAEFSPAHNDLQMPTVGDDFEMEVEHPRDHAEWVIPETTSLPEREEFTPLPISPTRKTVEIEELPTLEIQTRSVQMSHETATPMFGPEDQLSVGDTNIPEFMLNSEKSDDLSFVEADSMQYGSNDTELDKLSVRTRSVAQYLMKKSPMTQFSKEHSGDMSLKRILEGKSRKQCARLFYETLVLKSYGLIDVRQEEAYGDITLSITQSLFSVKL